MTAHSYPLRSSHHTVGMAAAAILATAAAIAAGAVLWLGSTTASPSQTAGQSPAGSLTLSQRLVAPTGPGGFVRMTAPSAVPATARLRGLGFVGGLNEQLHGVYPMQAQAVSIVERFGSAAAATAELNYRYDVATTRATRSGAVVRLGHVAGIPGAVAWSLRDHGTAAANVAFTSGPYFYLVGTASPSGASGTPGLKGIVVAAQSQYLQAGGCLAPRARAHIA
jgi:hypothetical protein